MEVVELGEGAHGLFEEGGNTYRTRGRVFDKIFGARREKYRRGVAGRDSGGA
jgi:hypothetical protein